MLTLRIQRVGWKHIGMKLRAIAYTPGVYEK